MIKKLLKLPPATLNKIASDIGVTEGTQAEKAAAVSHYYRTYGYRWNDLVARYNLPP